DGVPYNGQETDSGKLWRSDDGGENWKLVSYDRRMGGRTHYYFRVEVSPDNENEVHFLTNPYGRSTDGGQTLVGGGGPGAGGGGAVRLLVGRLARDRMRRRRCARGARGRLRAAGGARRRARQGLARRR